MKNTKQQVHLLISEITFEQERLNQYEQVFENKHGFLANLSILDLFLNEGKIPKHT